VCAAVVHQEHSLFIFPGMTEALSMQRKGISYNPFSLFSTSLIPSIHKNVRRMHETIGVFKPPPHSLLFFDASAKTF
jgi:hypothetical protein